MREEGWGAWVAGGRSRAEEWIALVMCEPPNPLTA